MASSFDISELFPEVHIGRIWMRHTEPPCPSTSIANIFADRTDRIHILVSDSRKNTWSTVLVHTPYASSREIEELKSITDLRVIEFHSVPQQGFTVIGLSMKDLPLHTVTTTKVLFLRLRRYTATPDHEEFQVIAFPREALSKLAAELTKFGTAYIRSSMTYREFAERQRSVTPILHVLSPEEERIFRAAFESGYFDYPRTIKTDELASQLRISSSALSIKLRRISERLYQAYFERYMR